MGRIGDREWHAKFRRDQEQFDRTWRWLWPVGLVLAVLFVLVELAVWGGVAAWLWSQIP